MSRRNPADGDNSSAPRPARPAAPRTTAATCAGAAGTPLGQDAQQRIHEVGRRHAQVRYWGWRSATCSGPRPGAERYEQLKRTYQRVSDHPAVQGAAGVVRAQVEERMNGGRHTADATTNGRSH